jgi:hypothetical protein
MGVNAASSAAKVPIQQPELGLSEKTVSYAAKVSTQPVSKKTTVVYQKGKDDMIHPPNNNKSDNRSEKDKVCVNEFISSGTPVAAAPPQDILDYLTEESEYYALLSRDIQKNTNETQRSLANDVKAKSVSIIFTNTTGMKALLRSLSTQAKSQMFKDMILAMFKDLCPNSNNSIECEIGQVSNPGRKTSSQQYSPITVPPKDTSHCPAFDELNAKLAHEEQYELQLPHMGYTVIRPSRAISSEPKFEVHVMPPDHSWNAPVVKGLIDVFLIDEHIAAQHRVVKITTAGTSHIHRISVTIAGSSSPPQPFLDRPRLVDTITGESYPMHFNGTTTCRDCFTVGEHPENTSCEAGQRALNYRNRTKTHKYPSSIPGCSNCGRPHPREKCQNLSLPKQQQEKKWIPVVGTVNKKEAPKNKQV